jgi:hypothetical protein
MIDLLVKVSCSFPFKKRKNVGFTLRIMSNKQLDSPLPSTTSLAESKFNELDNWLGLMEVDPPKSREEKQAMYDRLLDILADMFEPKSDTPFRPLDRRLLLKDMRKIIER